MHVHKHVVCDCHFGALGAARPLAVASSAYVRLYVRYNHNMCANKPCRLVKTKTTYASMRISCLHFVWRVRVRVRVHLAVKRANDSTLFRTHTHLCNASPSSSKSNAVCSRPILKLKLASTDKKHTANNTRTRKSERPSKVGMN